MHGERLNEATRILLHEVIPAFAEQLAASAPSQAAAPPTAPLPLSRHASLKREQLARRVPIDNASLPRALHSRGINIRHLGWVWRCVPAHKPEVRQVLLVEMVARTLKNMLRAVLRNAHQSDGAKISEHRLRQLIVHFLNRVTNPAEQEVMAFWGRDMPRNLAERFGTQVIDSLGLSSALPPDFGVWPKPEPPSAPPQIQRLDSVADYKQGVAAGPRDSLLGMQRHASEESKRRIACSRRNRTVSRRSQICTRDIKLLHQILGLPRNLLLVLLQLLYRLATACCSRQM